MTIAIAETIWIAVASYLVLGAIFALAMVSGLIKRLDPLAASAPVKVKLLLLPGLAALWPLIGYTVLRTKPGAKP